MSRIPILPVAPVGKRETVAFVTRRDGCGLERIQLNDYPESPRAEELRDRRVAAGLNIREWASRLGASPVEVSGLERGSHTVADWDALFAILDGAA